MKRRSTGTVRRSNDAMTIDDIKMQRNRLFMPMLLDFLAGGRAPGVSHVPITLASLG
jgi:hypothetical protein